MKNSAHEGRLLFLLIMLVVLMAPFHSIAQFSEKWMTVGSLHNWFSESGCEIEQNSPRPQQWGLQWPAIFDYQDSQAQKGMWIGARNFTDEKDDFYPYKVVHVGPRTNGVGEVFPVEFRTISKFVEPAVIVDGVTSYLKEVESNEYDDSMPWDRMIINTVNSHMGITMTRKIMQFSHPQHDNYMIYDYITIITPSDNVAKIATSDSLSGKLLIYIFDDAGNRVQDHFSFVTYNIL